MTHTNTHHTLSTCSQRNSSLDAHLHTTNTIWSQRLLNPCTTAPPASPVHPYRHQCPTISTCYTRSCTSASVAHVQRSMVAHRVSAHTPTVHTGCEPQTVKRGVLVHGHSHSHRAHRMHAVLAGGGSNRAPGPAPLPSAATATTSSHLKGLACNLEARWGENAVSTGKARLTHPSHLILAHRPPPSHGPKARVAPHRVELQCTTCTALTHSRTRLGSSLWEVGKQVRVCAGQAALEGSASRAVGTQGGLLAAMPVGAVLVNHTRPTSSPVPHMPQPHHPGAVVAPCGPGLDPHHSEGV